MDEIGWVLPVLLSSVLFSFQLCECLAQLVLCHTGAPSQQQPVTGSADAPSPQFKLLSDKITQHSS